jgi:hypothetical protein
LLLSSLFQKNHKEKYKRTNKIIYKNNKMPELTSSQRQLLNAASIELEAMKRSRTSELNTHTRFPSACLNLLYQIPGNRRCIDCKASNPQWAAVSFGALLCIECSGHHRHLGVNTSVVRSVTMDSWTHSDVLAMLEGGNQQLNGFFSRHALSPSSSLSENENGRIVKNRYRTNAGKFYRNNLELHASKVINKGMYKGRCFYRQPKKRSLHKGKEIKECYSQ